MTAGLQCGEAVASGDEGPHSSAFGVLGGKNSDNCRLPPRGNMVWEKYSPHRLPLGPALRKAAKFAKLTYVRSRKPWLQWYFDL